MRLSSLLFLLVALVFTGCQQQNNPTPPPAPTAKPVAQLPAGYELVNFGAPW